MINPTTASYLTKSIANDRQLAAARDRRLAIAKPTAQLAGPRPVRFTAAARFAAHLVSPFRSQVATR
jgi:hypothetical protein